MGLSEFYKVMYSDAVQDLAGFQSKSLLKSLVMQESKQGEIVYLDGISPSDQSTRTAMSALKSRKTYEEIGSPDLADWVAIQTPHMEVNKQRTVCLPYENLWSHWFRKEDEIAELSNPQGRTLRQGSKEIVRNQDYEILNAGFAASVQRGQDKSAVSAVDLPAGQYVNVTDGVFDKDVCSEIKKRYEENWVEDERIITVISPEAKKSLIDNSGDKIHSSDFVTRQGLFEKGELPDVYGVHCLVHPMISTFAAAMGWTDVFLTFTEYGLTYNQFEPLESPLDQSIAHKNQYIAMMREFIGAARVDDKRVLIGRLDSSLS